jgi:hypothetical protein
MALELLTKRKRLIKSGEKPSIVYRQNEQRWIVGPLGIWPYPIINVFLQIILIFRGQTSEPKTIFPRTASRRIEYVRDHEGRIIEKYEEIEVE